MNLSDIAARIDHFRNGGVMWLHYNKRLYRMNGDVLQNHDTHLFENDFIGNVPKMPIHECFWGDSTWPFRYFMGYWESEDILVSHQAVPSVDKRQIRRVEL